MSIGVLTLHLRIPGCGSLKEKRSRLKPLLARLHREFNISVAEIQQNDNWKEAIIACAIVSNDAVHSQRSLQEIVKWIEASWPDVFLTHQELELL